jgi:hypothetical protein
MLFFYSRQKILPNKYLLVFFQDVVLCVILGPLSKSCLWCPRLRSLHIYHVVVTINCIKLSSNGLGRLECYDVCGGGTKTKTKT